MNAINIQLHKHNVMYVLLLFLNENKHNQRKPLCTFEAHNTTDSGEGSMLKLLLKLLICFIKLFESESNMEIVCHHHPIHSKYVNNLWLIIMYQIKFIFHDFEFWTYATICCDYVRSLSNICSRFTVLEG